VLSVGCVVEVFAAHITPPHNKYYVVACLEPMVLGFFINSDINRYIQRRPQLAAAQVRVLKAEHTFLHHDSWLDCSDIHTFTRHFLDREVRTNPPAMLGTLSPSVQAEMLRVVANSYTLAVDHIRWITSAFVPPQPPETPQLDP
jgi:hypothetical protein